MKLDPETLRWGAELFARRGGFMPYSTSFAGRIHAKDPELMRRLQESFGGRVSGIAGTLQWRLTGDELQTFLEAIRPLMPDYAVRYGTEILELVDDALVKLATPRGSKRRGRAALQRVRVVAGEDAESPLPEPPDDPAAAPRDGEEAFGRIPSEPWNADLVLFDLAADSRVFLLGMLLEGESTDEAARFAAAARANAPQLRVLRSGVWVRLCSS